MFLSHPIFLLAVLTLITSCKLCEKSPEICIPPQEDVEEPSPTPPSPSSDEPLAVDAGAPVAAPTHLPFTWSRNGEAFAEQTRMMSLRTKCVDNDDEFIFSTDSQDYGWDELEDLESVDFTIQFGDYNDASDCYVLIRQNQQETPDREVPSPGSIWYRIDGVEYEAPLMVEGPFEGYWKIERFHE